MHLNGERERSIPLGYFAFYRIVIAAWAITMLALYRMPFRDWLAQVTELYLRTSAHSSLNIPFIQDWVLSPWFRWDAMWYLRIAADGYTPGGSTAFAPLYPFLIKMLGILLGGNYLLAALVISNVALALSCIFLFREARQQFDAPTAARTLLYLLVFPTAFYLVGAYSESLFLLLMLVAWYFARQNRWQWVVAMAVLATMTRFQAIGLAVPLLYMWWRSPKPRGRWGLALLFVPLIPLAWGLYVGYFLHLEFPWQSLEQTWHEYWGWPWSGILGNVAEMFVLNISDILTWVTLTLNLVLTLAAIGLILIGMRYLPFEYTLLNLVLIMPPLMKIAPDGLLVSMSRYVLVLWPNFMVLAFLGQKRLIHWLYLLPAILVQFICSAMFFMWYWIA